MPRFFFSYARANDGPYLTRFYQDLCEVVAEKVGGSKSDIAFRDTSDIQAGQSWPDELAEALCKCDAFVAIYSPAYFDSKMCMREWEVFAERERSYQQQAGLSKPPGMLLPVLWIQPRADQQVPSDVQYNHGEFGALYAERGANYLVRMSRHADDYQDFLWAFAERLAQMMLNHQMPELTARPDLRSAGSSDGRPRPAGSAPRADGPRKIWFVVVAGASHELQGVRKSLAAYGEEPEDWQPYAPASTHALCPAVEEVAGHAGLRSASVSAAGEAFKELETELLNRNEVAVLLVDAWTLRLPQYHERIKLCNIRRLLTSAVMVPWNQDDDETMEQEGLLAQTLDAVFDPRDPETFRAPVLSHAALLNDLSNVITELQRRSIEHSKVLRPVTSGTVVTRPTLRAP